MCHWWGCAEAPRDPLGGSGRGLPLLSEVLLGNSGGSPPLCMGPTRVCQRESTAALGGPPGSPAGVHRRARGPRHVLPAGVCCYTQGPAEVHWLGSADMPRDLPRVAGGGVLRCPSPAGVMRGGVLGSLGSRWELPERLCRGMREPAGSSLKACAEVPRDPLGVTRGGGPMGIVSGGLPPHPGAQQESPEGVRQGSSGPAEGCQQGCVEAPGDLLGLTRGGAPRHQGARRGSMAGVCCHTWDLLGLARGGVPRHLGMHWRSLAGFHCCA